MKRILTSLVAIPLLIYLIKFAPVPVFVWVSFAVMLLAFYEYYLLVRKGNDSLIYGAAAAIAALIFLSFYYSDAGLPFFFPISAAIILIAALFSRIKVADALHATAASLLGAWYVGGLTGYLVGLRLIEGGSETGSDFLMMLFLIIWFGDTAAFFFGKKFGRYKLSIISPNKTVEGAVAGLIFSVLGALLCCMTFVAQIGTVDAAILGGIVGLAGQVGDLCESLLKRSANVKDSGTLIPGHGGILDRLDSLLFGAPAMYYYFYLILQKG